MDVGDLPPAMVPTANGSDVIDSEPANAHTIGGMCPCDLCPPGEVYIEGICCVDSDNNGVCDEVPPPPTCTGNPISVVGGDLSCQTGSVTLTAL